MIDKSKLTIYCVLVGIVGLLIFVTVILSNKVKSLKEDLNIAHNNIEAYSIENSNLKDRNIEFQLTVNQLNYSQDSLINKLNSVRKELKIKDKNIKRLEYLLSVASTKDSIVFRDTIFTEKVKEGIDTTIAEPNGWYKTTLCLGYPNIIEVSNEIHSEKYIITSWHKETVAPPKKSAFCRFFQKKHKVVEVEVVEENPYVENRKQKFIEIIK